MPASKLLRIARPAQRDLSRIGAHTKEAWGETQKQKYLGQIKRMFAILTKTPGLGLPRDDLGAGLRSRLVGSHVIFYRDTDTELTVSRVLHQRMDPALRFRSAERR